MASCLKAADPTDREEDCLQAPGVLKEKTEGHPHVQTKWHKWWALNVLSLFFKA